MKKTALLLLSFGLSVQYSSGCDICGCGTLYTPGNSIYRSGQNALSLVWDQTRFESEHLPSILKGQGGLSERSSESFHRISLMGQWRLFNQVQAQLILPYQYTLKEGIAQESIGGLGDLSLGLSTPIWNDSIGAFVHLLKMTARVKAPSGNYQPERISESISRYMFNGTGSWDYSLGLSWAWMRKNWSLSWQAYYARNGLTQDGLNWGDAVGQAAEAWYFKTRNQIKYGFFAGLNHDFRQKDQLRNTPVLYSGYTLYSLSAGSSLVWNNMVLEARYWLPIAQSIAKGQVQMDQRYQIKLQWLIP